MPLYEYQCSICERVHTTFRRVSECDAPGPGCCGLPARKIVSRPARPVIFEAYVSPATGRYITSWEQRKDDLKRSGCRPYEGLETERQEAARARQYADEKHEKVVESCAEQALKDLPEQHKRALGV